MSTEGNYKMLVAYGHGGKRMFAPDYRRCNAREIVGLGMNLWHQREAFLGLETSKLTTRAMVAPASYHPLDLLRASPWWRERLALERKPQIDRLMEEHRELYDRIAELPLGSVVRRHIPVAQVETVRVSNAFTAPQRHESAEKPRTITVVI